MPRVLWKGAISFGLVHIPVGLYSAAEKRNELDFTMLDRRNLAPVGYRRINKETGREVPREQIVKGYEYEKDRYVVLSDEDFRSANVKATQTVEIVGFVEAGQIPLIYFDTPYYLAPGKRGEKGYALLRETLKRAKKVGIANVVIHTKQYLATLVPMDSMLVLNTLRYADEIRSIDEFDLPGNNLKAAGVNEKEIDLALRLVEGMSEKWAPDKYRDTFRKDILARVKEKIKAGRTKQINEAKAAEVKPKGAEIIDLMALLRRSVETNGKGHRAGGDRGERAAKTKKRAAAKSRAKSARRAAPLSGVSALDEPSGAQGLNHMTEDA